MAGVEDDSRSGTVVQGVFGVDQGWRIMIQVC